VTKEIKAHLITPDYQFSMNLSKIHRQQAHHSTTTVVPEN
jgi:hypothetical protein